MTGLILVSQFCVGTTINNFKKTGTVPLLPCKERTLWAITKFPWIWFKTDVFVLQYLNYD